MPPSRAPLDLVSEILDKLIETHRASTQAITGLRDSIDKTGQTLDEVRGFFQNGFRSDLKTLAEKTETINESVNNFETHIKELTSCVKEINRVYEKPWQWVKLFGIIIIATTGAITAIALLIVKLVDASK